VTLAAAISVLFIGNSYTYVNDLPKTFAALAEAKGVHVTVDSITEGGAPLEAHAKNPRVGDKLRERAWDFVVLQEQSQRPAFDAPQVDKEVLPAAAELDRQIHEARAQTRTVFFETWARRDGDKDNCKDVPAVCTHDGQQQRLSATYARLAHEHRALLAPVGTAWSRVRGLDLYQADGSHPSPLGTYLAACVFFDVLTKERSDGAPGLGAVADAEARALQKIADEVAAR
jgi:hypothetical protein